MNSIVLNSTDTTDSVKIFRCNLRNFKVNWKWVSANSLTCRSVAGMLLVIPEGRRLLGALIARLASSSLLCFYIFTCVLVYVMVGLAPYGASCHAIITPSGCAPAFPDYYSRRHVSVTRYLVVNSAFSIARIESGEINWAP
jgi:hypothetical protein